MHNAPFVFGRLVEGGAFMDRVAETVRLKANFECGINTIHISSRRMGKTSLVQKVLRLSASDRIRIPCRNEAEFLSAYATAVVKATAGRWEEWTQTVAQFLSRLWSSVNREATLEDLNVAIERLIDSCQPSFVCRSKAFRPSRSPCCVPFATALKKASR